MTAKPIFHEASILEATAAIVEALRPHIANEYNSTVNEAVAGTAAYKTGLNNGETHLAIMRALVILQQEVSVKFASLLYDEGDDDLAGWRDLGGSAS